MMISSFLTVVSARRIMEVRLVGIALNMMGQFQEERRKRNERCD
jgi:hypothetical protein